MNLTERAARYFGLGGEPRTSIKTSRRACIIVARQQSYGAAICFYSEETSPARAEYMWLGADNRDALIAALSSPRTDQTKEDR